MSDLLLARSAENFFWLARYVERAENLARILDVNATFARDSCGSRDWLPVVQINADEERFHARHPSATADAVLRFYVTDRDNPNSIVSAIRYARENARALRPRTPREMWTQINVFYNHLHGIDDAAFAPGNLARLLGRIREACQTHAGVAEGTLYRDQAWYFYEIGRQIERADQTTRLLDIKYHLLLPKVSGVGSPIDLGQWNVLLRSAGGYHAYRLTQHGGVTPSGVAGLLLLDPRFPRSVFRCLIQTDRLLTELRTRYGLGGGGEAAAELGRLRAMLETITMRQVLVQGLHEFLDLVQRRLIAITDGLSTGFFGQEPPAAQAQSQTQTPSGQQQS